MQTFLTIKEASRWASSFLDRNVSPSNISYLMQYGKIRRHEKEKSVLVSIEELKNYYASIGELKKKNWKEKLGDDLNWELSFDNLREKDTTKHVHRLHPYKGKFIPQLVEYFIDTHTDDFKKEVFFKEGDIVLDPFAGSGTTLVQSCEMGLHSIGIDISEFNCMITHVKLSDYDTEKLKLTIQWLLERFDEYEKDKKIEEFEQELSEHMSKFNANFFPNHEFKYQVEQGSIDEDSFGLKKEKEFKKIFDSLVKKYGIRLEQVNGSDSFLGKWYVRNIREEIDYIFNRFKDIKDDRHQQVISLILSRTIRSCRATTHSDLATLKEPKLSTYYCYKHKKICKPIFSIKYWLNRYSKDTISRLEEFQEFKTNTHHIAIPADSRTVNIMKEIESRNKSFYSILKKNKIKGIFSSPPYVGQIDYHEQHAYAYDLLGMGRKDELEIGPLYKGKGKKAQESYVQGISDVLNNCKQFLDNNYDIFLVANDKHGLYPRIAELSGMQIVNEYKRPVLNRTERDRNPYSEIIFHLKEKS